MAAVIAKAFVEVFPEVSKFSKNLSKDLNKAFSGFKKISVGISSGSITKAFREVTKLNLALRATILGFTALAFQGALGGIIAVTGAVGELSGALAVLPAGLAAAGLGFLAFKVGTAGVGDAFKALAKGDEAKLEKALEKLSGNAKDTVLEFKRLTPELKKFKDAVQDSLFAGIAPVVRDLASKLLPTFQAGLVGISHQFNGAAKDFARFISSTKSVKDLNTIFGNTTATVEQLRPGIISFSKAFLDISTVGSRFLPILAKQLSGVGDKFQKFIENARASGALDAFIERGLAAFESLLKTVTNLGSAIGSIFKAARGEGISLLSTLEEATSKLAAFLKSDKGQEQLGKFLANMKTAFTALGPPLGALINLFVDKLTPVVTRFAQIVGPSLTNLINKVGQAIDIAAPGIETFARGVADFVVAITPALPAIGKLVGAIGDGLGRVLERVGPTLETFITNFANTFTDVFSNPALISGVSNLAKAFFEFLNALLPLVAPLTQIGLVIVNVLVAAFHALQPVITPIVAVLGALVPIVQALGSVLSAVFPAFLTLAIVVGGALLALNLFKIGVGTINTVLSAASGEVGSFGKKISGFASFLGGPWGIALGLGITALTVFGADSAAAAKKQQELAAAAKSVNDAIRDQGGVINDTVRATAAKALEDEGVLANATLLGVSTKEVTTAFLEQGSALDDLRAKLSAMITEQDKAGVSPFADQGTRSATAKRILDELDALTAARDKDNASSGRQIQAASGVSAAAKEASDAYKEYARSVQDAFEKLVQTGQVSLSARDAERQLAASISDAQAAFEANGKTLDINTAAGRANQAALDRIASSALTAVDALNKNGASTDVLRGKVEQSRQAFIAQATQMGLEAPVAQALADKLGLIPGNYTATVKVDNAQAVTAIDGTKALLATLKDKTITLTVQERRAILKESQVGGLATGGSFGAGETTWVGERGPEIVQFGRAGKVFTNDESMRMMDTLQKFKDLTTAKTPAAGVAPVNMVAANNTNVQVFIDGRELKDVMVQVADDQNRDLRRTILAGAGGIR